jgi:[protein-PII] uridylyltransferase
MNMGIMGPSFLFAARTPSGNASAGPAGRRSPSGRRGEKHRPAAVYAPSPAPPAARRRSAAAVEVRHAIRYHSREPAPRRAAPPVSKATAELEGLLRARPRDAKAAKERLRDERTDVLARLRARPSGVEAARALAEFADSALDALFESERLALEGAPPPLALLATGGYGRRELAPCSDVDLLILHRGAADRKAAEALATRFFQALWDLGFEVGHAVRSLEEVARTLTRDLVTATALLDARRISGDESLARELHEVGDDFLAKFGAGFLRAKLEEAEERYRRRGAVAYLSEPNVKESRGALRDIELLRLFERAGVSPAIDDDARLDVEDAHERLLETRLLMHLLEGKKQDRLGFDLQPRVAEAFGFRDSRHERAVEAFMADYFRSAKAVERALGLARFALERRSAERGDEFAPAERPRRLTDRLVAVGGRIELAAEGALASASDLVPALELFLHAQREKLEPTEAAIEAVRRLLPRVDDRARESPAHAKVFRDLLGGRNRVGAALRAMHRAGLLGEYLPEFGTLDGLWQQDPYHDFTVDEHSLRAIDALERFGESAEREDLLRVEVLGNVRRLDVLRLGVLLHDMGKGKGGGHVQVGVAMVPEVARRLGLDVDEGRLVRFLVEAHLEMSRTTEQRDFTSPETLARFAALCGDEERLDMLYLLTVADIRAVGAHAFPRWKDALLTSLYQLTRDFLRAGGKAHAWTAEARREEVLRRLPEGLAAADLDRHLELAPRRYPLEVEPFDIAIHLRLVRDLERGRDPATAYIVEGPLRHFWVCTRDRPRLFASVAGCIAAKGANIISADAYTRTDGVVLDKLTIVPGPGQAEDEQFWEGLEKLLADVFAGRQAVDKVVAEARARVPYHARREGPPRPTIVKASNKLSDRYTVVDVGAEDRPGLLYDIARRLSELGLDIHYSKISTRANRAADVFYVSRDGAKVKEEEFEAIEAAFGDL